MPAARTATFTESVIREMTRVANQYGAINLAQGFPDFPMPRADEGRGCFRDPRRLNQYAITWGSAAAASGRSPRSTAAGTVWR